MQWNNKKPPPTKTTPRAPVIKSPSSTTQSSQPTGKRPSVHVVQGGESFYSIGLKYGLSYKTLAAWNNMSTKDVIFRGQKLKLYPPANSSATNGAASSGSTSQTGSTSSPAIKLQWPLKGRIVHRFNDLDRTVKGLDIGGQSGQKIKAAASGKVVYSGSGLVGLGNVIIIKHNSTYLTAYGYNDKLLFTEGSEVKQGQEIAIVGTGPDGVKMLHFEVRKNGKPVDPLTYLPR